MCEDEDPARLKEDGDQEHLGLKWRAFGEEMYSTLGYRSLQEIESWRQGNFRGSSAAIGHEI